MESYQLKMPKEFKRDGISLHILQPLNYNSTKFGNNSLLNHDGNLVLK